MNIITIERQDKFTFDDVCNLLVWMRVLGQFVARIHIPMRDRHLIRVDHFGPIAFNGCEIWFVGECDLAHGSVSESSIGKRIYFHVNGCDRQAVLFANLDTIVFLNH